MCPLLWLTLYIKISVTKDFSQKVKFEESAMKEFSRGTKISSLANAESQLVLLSQAEKSIWWFFTSLWLVFLVTWVLYVQVFGQDDRMSCFPFWCIYCEVNKPVPNIIRASFLDKSHWRWFHPTSCLYLYKQWTSFAKTKILMVVHFTDFKFNWNCTFSTYCSCDVSIDFHCRLFD